jgi:pyruvate-ferredoxin/flavodoxin oxidoreductase
VRSLARARVRATPRPPHAGEKVGLLKVHLFRPWSASHFLAALPARATRVAVLDRTKEQGSQGEPL